MEKAAPKRIKVLLVINDFLIGGAQKLLIDLAAHMDRTRFEPVLMTLFRFGEDENDYLYGAIPEGIEVHQLCFKGVRDLASWRALVRELRAIDPDVAFANLFFTNTVMRVLAPFFRYRVITAEHNTYTKKAKLHQWVDRVLAPLSARIVAVSNTVRDFTAKQERIDPEKFIVINSAIDIERLRRLVDQCDESAVRARYGLAPDDRVMVNVARVVPQKNHQMLVDGFALFAKQYPQYRLFIVGSGSHLEKMRAYAAERGLDRVRFLGYQEEIAPLMRVADFFVSTSFIEGFGIAHGEALSCGVPVLTTKTAGPDEMITEGVNGSFVAEYTPEAVAEGMERMAKADRAAMRIAARASAERYSIDRAVRAYESLFAEVAGVRPQGR